MIPKNHFQKKLLSSCVAALVLAAPTRKTTPKKLLLPVYVPL
jgi:hypothetical protein